MALFVVQHCGREFPPKGNFKPKKKHDISEREVATALVSHCLLNSDISKQESEALRQMLILKVKSLTPLNHHEDKCFFK